MNINLTAEDARKKAQESKYKFETILYIIERASEDLKYSCKIDAPYFDEAHEPELKKRGFEVIHYSDIVEISWLPPL